MGISSNRWHATKRRDLQVYGAEVKEARVREREAGEVIARDEVGQALAS